MTQVTDANFTVEHREKARKVAQSYQVSWRKSLDSAITFFTIGVSTIGGTDIIKGNTGDASEFNLYQYFNESQYVKSLDWERKLNMPIGGVSKGLFNAVLDNTTKRFTPDFMGGDSEISTAVLPRRPVIINAGFNYDGVDHLVPQFVGLNTDLPVVNSRSRETEMYGTDFIDFLQNRYVDRTTMYTGLRSDVVIENLLVELGFTTAQYELDTGLNIIDFGVVENGDNFAKIINQIAQAEYGHFYQDEEGQLRFENRQHWDLSPHNQVSRLIFTADVLEAETIGQQHLINVVEVKSKKRKKAINDVIYETPLSILLEPGLNEIFVEYQDPVLEVTDTTITVFDNEFGDGTDKTSSIVIKSRTDFIQSSKYVFENTSSESLWLVTFTVEGRAAKVVEDIYVRLQDDSSVTAFEPQPYVIENPFIQNDSWAQSFAQMILQDFAEPENLQKLVIRAMPELQLGDLLDWQGKSWRIFDIRTTLDPGIGFIQELQLLRREITTYFRIGISTIGGEDQIAP